MRAEGVAAGHELLQPAVPEALGQRRGAGLGDLVAAEPEDQQTSQRG